MDNQPYRTDWKKALYADGQKMLMDAGLYRKEADAMMQTWWASYFETPGLRVFWIVPRATVDEILPLKVSPTPKDTVRVIVGRSEILRPSFEKRLGERPVLSRLLRAGEAIERTRCRRHRRRQCQQLTIADRIADRRA